MDKKIIKIKCFIEEIIKEHNDIWKDISIANRKYYTPAGYNCFSMKEEDIIVIASGLIRKGVKIE